MSENKSKGFAALTLVLVVSGILLTLVFAYSIESGLFFDQAIRKEYRTMNYYYAHSCLDQGILALSHDYFFSVSVPLSLEEFHCSILSVEKEGDIRIITVVGNYMNADVYRKATVRLHENSLEIISIE